MPAAYSGSDDTLQCGKVRTGTYHRSHPGYGTLTCALVGLGSPCSHFVHDLADFGLLHQAPAGAVVYGLSYHEPYFPLMLLVHFVCFRVPG